MSSYIDPRNKLLGHLDRLAQIKDGQRPAPINVEVDLSNRCSLGCEWCHFAYTHTRGPLAGKAEKPTGAIPGGDLMDVGLAMRMIDQLHQSGVRSITWTGGGEPTLHPSFDRITQYACVKIQQGLYTHGGHIDSLRARMLKACFEWVYVSLDAANAESYRKSKGMDGFERACNGIRYMAEASGPATIGVGFLIHAGNYQDAPAMAELANRLGADYAQFRPVIDYVQDAPGVPGTSPAWVDEAERVLSTMEGQPGVEVDLERFRMYRDWQGHGYQTCWWSGLQTVITPDGSVWTCVNKREHPGALLGNLNERTFGDIWSGSALAQVDSHCRVMCRGHIPNTVADEVMQYRKHAAFV